MDKKDSVGIFDTRSTLKPSTLTPPLALCHCTAPRRRTPPGSQTEDRGAQFPVSSTIPARSSPSSGFSGVFASMSYCAWVNPSGLPCRGCRSSVHSHGICHRRRRHVIRNSMGLATPSTSSTSSTSSTRLAAPRQTRRRQQQQHRHRHQQHQ